MPFSPSKQLSLCCKEEHGFSVMNDEVINLFGPNLIFTNLTKIMEQKYNDFLTQQKQNNS